MERWRDGRREGWRERGKEMEWRKRSLPPYILNFLSSEWLKKNSDEIFYYFILFSCVFEFIFSMIYNIVLAFKIILSFENSICVYNVS